MYIGFQRSGRNVTRRGGERERKTGERRRGQGIPSFSAWTQSYQAGRGKNEKERRGEAIVMYNGLQRSMCKVTRQGWERKKRNDEWGRGQGISISNARGAKAPGGDGIGRERRK